MENQHHPISERLGIRNSQRPSRSHNLLGMGYAIIELANEALAEQDVDGAQSLIELSMSVLHTAIFSAPEIETAMNDLRRQLDTITAQIRNTLPTTADPENQWPCRVV